MINFLKKLPMYRLAAYSVGSLAAASILLAALGYLDYNPFGMFFSAVFIFTVGLLADWAFSWSLGRKGNPDSVFISSMILFLIITPISAPNDWAYFSIAAWAAAWAMASKYVIAVDKRHLFNPAAFAVFLTSVTLGQTASWWVGTAAMLPFVLVFGSLMVWKIRRYGVVATFLISAVFINMSYRYFIGSDMVESAKQLLVSTPIFFFAFIMLTELRTMPLFKKQQRWYGGLIGLIYSPFIHVGAIYSSPELSLLLGNFFAFLLRFAKKKPVSAAPVAAAPKASAGA